MPDDSSVQAVMYGPLVLVGRMGTEGITAESLQDAQDIVSQIEQDLRVTTTGTP